MASEKPSKTFSKAVINTGVGQLPALLQVGGKALLRQLQCDPPNISGISTVVQVIPQAVLPQWALDAHSHWAKLAKKGVLSHSLAKDIGIDTVSEAQASLAEADGFSKTVFVITNLGAALGLPKLASALSHLENPSLEATLGDEAYKVVTSMYSAAAIHSRAQSTIIKHSDNLEQMIAPLFNPPSSGITRDAEADVWALGKSPYPTPLLMSKLLLSAMAISRFVTPVTPIQYPIIATHLSFVLAVAMIFGFRLTCDGKVIHKGDGDKPNRIELTTCHLLPHLRTVHSIHTPSVPTLMLV